jgi:hypothetical protein
MYSRTLSSPEILVVELVAADEDAGNTVANSMAAWIRKIKAAKTDNKLHLLSLRTRNEARRVERRRNSIMRNTRMQRRCNMPSGRAHRA